MASRLLNLLPHLIVTVEIEDICNEVESVLIILDVSVEACEVEAVGKVVLVNFTKVLIAARRDELENERLAMIKRKSDGEGVIYPGLEVKLKEVRALTRNADIGAYIIS